MNKPVFSIVAPAIKKQFYDGFYESISKGNITPFEIIFVGDNEPIKIMPDNLYYIYTKVKPAQCFEIAARQAQGEYLIPIADDILFSEEFLNNMHSNILKYDRNKYFIGCKYSRNDRLLEEIQYYDPFDHTSERIAMAPALRSDIWKKLGGMDKRFVYAWADIDMQFRFKEYGLELILSDIIVNEFDTPNKKKRLFKHTGEQGKELIDKFWQDKNGSISNKRFSEVETFDDKDILKISQGFKVGHGRAGKRKWE